MSHTKFCRSVIHILSGLVVLALLLAAGVASASEAKLDTNLPGPFNAASQDRNALLHAQRPMSETIPGSLYLPLIYTTPLLSAQHRLSDPADDVTSFQVSPDGRYAVYSAMAEDGYYNLFSVRLADNQRAPLNERSLSAATPHAPAIVCCPDPGNPPVLGVFDVHISPDSQFVVYRQEDDTPKIKRVPIGGGAPLDLSGDVGQGRVLTDIQISPDSKYVVFGAYVDGSAQSWLYSVAMDGGSVVGLGAKLPAGDVVDSVHHFISPDSQSVIALVSRDVYMDNLYRFPIAGGVPVQINPTLVSGGSVDYIVGPFVTPDSRNVIYRADQDQADIWELYNAPLAGGAAQKLNGPLPQGHYVGFAVVSPDGQWVLYEAGNNQGAGWHLYRVPISGGLAVNLTAQLPAASDMLDFDFTPDSRAIVFRDGASSLHIIPVDAAAPSAASPAAGVAEGRYAISPDSQTVAFQNSTGLYTARSTGGVAVQIFDTAKQGSIGDFRFSQDGQYLAFTAAPDYASPTLYRTRATGGAIEQLSSSDENAANYNDFAFVPGSRSVVYRVEPAIVDAGPPSGLYYAR